MTDKLKIWCYNDAHNWGIMLAQAAAARGHDAHLFEDPRTVDHGHALVHMHFHPQVREMNKRVMQLISMNPEVRLVPSYRSSVLYDDKAEQARQFARWMPRTHIFWSPKSAREWMDRCAYPFVSKSREGAGAHDVRLIETKEQASEEVRYVFSHLGIKCRFGAIQRGYVLWQDFVPGNVGDVRVVRLGSKYMIVRRTGGKNSTKAISSGVRMTHVTGELDKATEEVFRQAQFFFEHEDIRWGAVDLIWSADSARWLVLELTVGWNMNGLYDCEFYDDSGCPTGVRGEKVWDVVVSEMEQGKL